MHNLLPHHVEDPSNGGTDQQRHSWLGKLIADWMLLSLHLLLVNNMQASNLLYGLLEATTCGLQP
jgi:hypothetical protein